MATTTFNGPVRSEKGFQVAIKNSTTGAYTTRYSGPKPDLTGLTATVRATATSITYVKNVITMSNYTGATTQAVTMPAATVGDIVVHLQTDDTAGGVTVLSFTCAGSDVFATGSKVESTAAALMTMDTSAASETVLTFTPANATTNRLTIGCYLYFTCITDGTWHFAYDLARDPLAVTGTFAWS